MRTTQKRVNAERAEKRGERGKPGKGSAHIREKGGPSARLRKKWAGAGCMECRDARSSGRSEEILGGYAEARAWREMGSVAEEEQRGEAVFSGKLRGKRFRNSMPGCIGRKSLNLLD